MTREVLCAPPRVCVCGYARLPREVPACAYVRAPGCAEGCVCVCACASALRACVGARGGLCNGL